MADAKVPGIGGVNKKTIGVAIVAGGAAAVYAWWRRKKDAAAAAAKPAASAYGYSALAYGYGGYAYGAELSETDQALAAEQDYGYGAYGYGGVGGYGVGSSVPVLNTIAPDSTNAEWAQAGQTFLVNNGGYSASTVSDALGAYITGANVGENSNIVEAAIAFEGYPPVPGADNYPPNINTGGNAGQGGGGTTGTSSSSKAAGAISNLTLTKKSATSLVAKWNPATGATGGYKYALTGPVNKSGSTRGTTVTLTGLKKGSYNFGVQGLPGGPGNNENASL
jgi:hypothetical protein